MAFVVSSEVSRPRITSTSLRIGTGLKKCMPMTRSGRAVAAASVEIGIEEVFEARIASGGSTASARRNTSAFTVGSSTTASIIRSAATRSSTVVMRASVASASASRRSRLLRTAARPRSVEPGYGSCSETRRPEAATTCAIPAPICPAPTTRTCSRSMPRGGYRRAVPAVDVNGARLWYDEAGSGEPLLLLHGGLGDSGLWEPVVPFLAERFRTVRTDFRFFGRSTGPAVPWSWHDDVIGLLDALGIERTVLVGLSVGGRIAYDVALDHPERIAALACVAPGLGAQGYTDEQAAEYDAAEADGDLEAMMAIDFEVWAPLG